MFQLIKGLGIASAVLLVGAGLLYLFGADTAAVAVAVVTVMLWILLILAAVWGAGSWWTVRTMERGAEIALKAQQINDTWDARKSAALASVFSAGVKVARDHQPMASLPGDLPTLALPSQAGEWLPPLETFSIDGDFSPMTNDYETE